MEKIEYMEQGTVNGRRTVRARHIEALDRERHYGRIMSGMTLVIGALIGSLITLFVQGVI